MAATVYGIPGSHPVRTGLLMLEHKGIDHRLVDVPSMLCRPYLRARGFPGPTVPAIRLDDGTKLQTTTAISRALDELVPDPPLFPADPEARRAVEQAERWGDELLQPVPRRLAYGALLRDRSALSSFFVRPLMGIPPKVVAATAGPIVRLGARVNGADEETVRTDLANVPALIDRVDALLAEGVIGGAEPNAADFQIAPSVRLLMLFEDLRGQIEGRPAADFAVRLVSHFPGHVPAVF
jgi:glutathione S-transferase